MAADGLRHADAEAEPGRLAGEVAQQRLVVEPRVGDGLSAASQLKSASQTARGKKSTTWSQTKTKFRRSSCAAVSC